MNCDVASYSRTPAAANPAESNDRKLLTVGRFATPHVGGQGVLRRIPPWARLVVTSSPNARRGSESTMSAPEAPGRSLIPVLHEIRANASVDAAFGGLTDAGSEHYVINQLVGVTSDGLRNLHVDIGAGLGGKAAALGKPVHVRDYCMARGITHHYDLAVREERLRAMFAVPVRVPSGPHGVVYGALRHAEVIGDRVIDHVMASVRRFERAAAVDIEVGRRLAALGVRPEEADRAGFALRYDAGDDQRVLDIYTELVFIESSMSEGADRQRIQALIERISAMRRDQTPESPAPLTTREREILSQVAGGFTNKKIANRLGVSAETVKSSLKSSMRKFSVNNRIDAVSAARRARLIP